MVNLGPLTSEVPPEIVDADTLNFEGYDAGEAGYRRWPCFDDQMRLAMNNRLALKMLRPTLCFGDMGITTHNQPCAVCGERIAVWSGDNAVFEPCWKCQDEGWVTAKKKKVFWLLQPFARWILNQRR